MSKDNNSKEEAVKAMCIVLLLLVVLGSLALALAFSERKASIAANDSWSQYSEICRGRNLWAPPRGKLINNTVLQSYLRSGECNAQRISSSRGIFGPNACCTQPQEEW